MTAATAFVIGVDPGLKGGIGLYNQAFPTASKVWDMPVKDGGVDAVALAALLKSITAEHNVSCAVIENVGGRPRQAGVFNFGLGTGIVHGCLASAGIEYSLVAPNLWKPALGLRRGTDETPEANKSRSRALAARLVPSLADKFSRVKDDGRAESILIAFHHAHRTK